MWKNNNFSGRLWPDWGSTTWAAMTGLGSIGLRTGHSLRGGGRLHNGKIAGPKLIAPPSSQG